MGKETKKVEVIRTNHLIAHDTIVECMGDTTLEEWKEFGLKLMQAEKFVQWYLGWWWNHGHKKWTREAESFIEDCGYKKKSLITYGYIETSVKPSIRMDNLAFNHHQLVAPMETATEQKKWLQKASNNEWTVAQFREAIKGEQETPPLPKGKYDIIYADPPWEYKNTGFETSAAKQYSTMPTSDICRLEIPSAENAVLFLWVTNPLLPDGLRVMEAWGFEYKTNFCWKKSSHIAGFYVFGQHELLFLGIKGSMPLEGEKFGSYLEFPSRKHSQKPNEVYDIIEKMYPREGIEVYFELFARQQYNKKWKVWGNEVNGTANSNKT